MGTLGGEVSGYLSPGQEQPSPPLLSAALALVFKNVSMRVEGGGGRGRRGVLFFLLALQSHAQSNTWDEATIQLQWNIIYRRGSFEAAGAQELCSFSLPVEVSPGARLILLLGVERCPVLVYSCILLQRFTSEASLEVSAAFLNIAYAVLEWDLCNMGHVNEFSLGALVSSRSTKTELFRTICTRCRVFWTF